MSALSIYFLKLIISSFFFGFFETSLLADLNVFLFSLIFHILGQVLSRENIEEVIKFAYREKLFLFADEVSRDYKTW